MGTVTTFAELTIISSRFFRFGVLDLNGKLIFNDGNDETLNIIQNLAAIAEENSASTEEFSASMEEQSNVCNYINKTRVPALVINTKVDQVTPYFMGEDIYNAIPYNNKRLFTVEDRKHVEIYQDHPNEYKESIINFIKQLA